MDPRLFLRGVAFFGTGGVAYPRARPDDAARLPLDTWHQAQIPVGVRLEVAGDAPQLTIAYRTKTDELGYRGDGAGRTFAVWRRGELVAVPRAHRCSEGGAIARRLPTEQTLRGRA